MTDDDFCDDSYPEIQAEEERDELKETIAALKSVLEQVEWVHDDGDSGYGAYDYCPWCGNHRAQGHESDCDRQMVLAKVRD